VYGVRTNDNPHSGSFNFEAFLASTGAGPVVQFNQSGVPVTAGDAYNFSLYADRLAGSAGDVEQYNIQYFNAGNGFVGQTGYTGFSPGANIYAETIVTNLVAPAGAVTAQIFIHNAGAAAPSLTATIDYDDVSFIAAVPEPTTMTLVGLGLVGAFLGLRKRRS
jgi:hypothetical protein